MELICTKCRLLKLLPVVIPALFIIVFVGVIILSVKMSLFSDFISREVSLVTHLVLLVC